MAETKYPVDMLRKLAAVHTAAEPVGRKRVDCWHRVAVDSVEPQLRARSTTSHPYRFRKYRVQVELKSPISDGQTMGGGDLVGD